ncbi:hypothetical protein [Oceaniglobus indicus]|uniref:hypothetical protein n=1 Tax=Oceaniglobus indicus TaxID=2047749 RepID=UPI000C190AA2|nr:hypothetical protein [Oceaniglobus indicus]
MTEIVATVTPSPFRRIFGAGIVGLLGAILIWIGLATAPSTGWRFVMLASGAAIIWCAIRLWQATAHRIELTSDELRDTSGRLRVQIGDMASIDRGTFAFKPSNGFVVVMKAAQPRGWAPGLWWRVGRRIGIGGVTSSTEAKFMAEQLALRIAARIG